MTSLILISSGQYPIDAPTGQAIADIAIPAMAQDINKNKQDLIRLVNDRWNLYTSWLVYLRTGLISDQIPPFNLPEMQELKPKAEVFSRMLDLCRGVWESSVVVQKHYPNPHVFWTRCLQEEKQWEIDRILQEEKVLKGTKEDGTRSFLKALKEGEVLLPRTEWTKHTYRLLSEAIRLASPRKNGRNTSEFRKLFWTPYLNSLQSFVNNIKINKSTKAVFEEGGSLWYQDGKAKIPFFPYSQ